MEINPVYLLSSKLRIIRDEIVVDQTTGMAVVSKWKTEAQAEKKPPIIFPQPPK
jgi:hypothetical protein